MISLIGKRVRIAEPHLIKTFYPNYRVVTDTPLFQGAYIYVSERLADFQRHSSMIWVSKFSPEVDLDEPLQVIELLQSFKKTPKPVVEYLTAIQTTAELWEKVRSFYLFDLLPEIVVEKQVFDLFLSLNRSNREIYNTFKKLKVPHAVIASSIITMLVKSQNVREIMASISPGYLKVLSHMSQTLKDVPSKLLNYYLSDRSEAQFLNLLFELKR